MQCCLLHSILLEIYMAQVIISFTEAHNFLLCFCFSFPDVAYLIVLHCCFENSPPTHIWRFYFRLQVLLLEISSEGYDKKNLRINSRLVDDDTLLPSCVNWPRLPRMS